MTAQNIVLKCRADFRFSRISVPETIRARELQKSDMHPTSWLACDCMPGMEDSKPVSAHDFGNRSEQPPKAAPKPGARTERVFQAFPREANSAAVAADTRRSNSMFASASLTPPLPRHSVVNA
jgi:hypothetical protein